MDSATRELAYATHQQYLADKFDELLTNLPADATKIQKDLAFEFYLIECQASTIQVVIETA
jgi:hypothetical protein